MAHLDINPNNIFFAQDFTLKLGDFGLSQPSSQPITVPSLVVSSSLFSSILFSFLSSLLSSCVMSGVFLVCGFFGLGLEVGRSHSTIGFPDLGGRIPAQRSAVPGCELGVLILEVSWSP